MFAACVCACVCMSVFGVCVCSPSSAGHTSALSLKLSSIPWEHNGSLLF